jgi:hypothetical protein
VVRDAEVAFARVGAGDPQRGHGAPAEHAGGVDGLPGGEPVCTVTASRSPPNACPVVTHASIQPASRSPATVRENHAGREPPSVMT